MEGEIGNRVRQSIKIQSATDLRVPGTNKPEKIYISFSVKPQSEGVYISLSHIQRKRAYHRCGSLNSK